MAPRRSATLISLVFVAAGAFGLWYWFEQTNETGDARPLPGMAEPAQPSDAQLGPPAAEPKQVETTAAPPKQLLAEWRSFSFNPPRYAIENLLVFNDFSCAVTVAKDDSRHPCTWKRIEGDRMELRFANGNTVIGRLGVPLSTEGKKKSGTAAYLVADLGNNQQQLFVLAGTEDDKMVLDTVRGEWDWKNQKYQTGIEHLHNALSRGSRYAPLRLGWIYATVSEFQRPKAALELLEPLAANGNDYGVLNALAAAYAANRLFDQATSTAATACKLAPEAQRPGCLQRMGQYRRQQPFVVSIASG